MTNQVTITGDATPYEVYGGLTAATHYLLAGIGDGAVAWRALSSSPDDQARMLIAATRYLERQSWQGAATTPAVGGTTLSWPRTGATYADGTAVDNSTVPAQIEQATYELAAIFAADATVQSAADAGSNISSVGAGGARVSYFVPTSAALGNASIFPPVVQALVGQFLAVAAVSVGAVTTGTSGCSEFETDDHNFDRSWPL